MRRRKNINCLSTSELHNLREALAALYLLPESNPNSYAMIAGLHGSPAPSYCIHGNAGFLTWHRKYLLALEDALRTIHNTVTIPYWNWSSGNTTGVPVACRNPTYVDRTGATVPNPLYSAPKPAFVGGGNTTRRADIDTTTFGDLATTAQTAIANNSWGNFVSGLNNVHGSVHGRVGGDMQFIATAGFDPIFHLHHCNVDRLWANWQVSHPGTMPASEANIDLPPFPRPFSNIWHTGADFEHISDWDYHYQNFCISFPVGVAWPAVGRIEFNLGDWIAACDCVELVLSTEDMPMHTVELKVFINLPKADSQTKTEDNPNFAGSFGIFGMGMMEGGMQMNRAKQPIKLGLNITGTLRKNIKSRDKTAIISFVPVFPEGRTIKKKDLDVFKVDLEAS